MVSAGLPHDLLRMPMQTITPAMAATAYAHPRPQLARLVQLGLLHRLAVGYYVVVPNEFVGVDRWRPAIEAAAGGIAAADFGPRRSILMGISAARLHGVVPRAVGVAYVAAPRRRSTVQLTDRPGTVRFIPRRIDVLDAETMHTELGLLMVTTPEQTVLDLAHKPDDPESGNAVRVLLDRCDPATLRELAAAQRLSSALSRALKGSVV